MDRHIVRRGDRYRVREDDKPILLIGYRVATEF
jgi:hypothetical protein